MSYRTIGGTVVTEDEYVAVFSLPARRRQSFVADGTFYAVLSTPSTAISWDWEYK